MHLFKEYTKASPFICPICNFQIFGGIKQHLKACDGRGPRRRRERKKGRKHSEETKKKISESLRKSPKNTGRGKTQERELERRRKISEAMKQNGGGYRKGSGRGKSGWYKGYWCDSTWELAFVIYHLDHKIPFKRNLEAFDYEFEGKQHKYYPDFIYEDGTYIEIKGRREFSKLDTKTQTKISNFPYKLNLFLEKEMENMIFYCEKFYGKNFRNLYDGRVDSGESH